VGERYYQMTEISPSNRTRKYFWEVQGAVLCKAAAMASSFLSIPLMISYLGPEKFGVWSTLLSIISWIVFFDLGIGNGLRNKVTESLAKGEKDKARQYTSTAYMVIGLIALTLWILLTAMSHYISWQSVFNTNAVSEYSLRKTIQIAAFFILLNLWLGLVAALLSAIQRTSMVALGQLVSNLLVLLYLFVFCLKTPNGSIGNLAIVYGISLVISNLLLSVWLYQRHAELRPHVHINALQLRPLLSLGVQFFIIQLAALIIFTTDKMLITQIFGPQYVTQYEVVSKLFNTITFLHATISTPILPAYADAFHRKDFSWMRKMLSMQLLIFGVIVVAVFIMSLLAKPIIAIWIGDHLIISSQLIAIMAVLVVVSTWNNIYAMLVNGVGEIIPQLYTAVVAMVVNIPLSIFFAKYTALGISGILLGTICSLLMAAVVLPVQVHHLLK
jgi:O-antigen/teichoic acid export membrane protein